MVKKILKFSKLIIKNNNMYKIKDSLINQRNSIESNLLPYSEKDNLKFGKNNLVKESKSSITKVIV